MAFPTSPSNGDLHTEFGRTFKYSSASNSWSAATPDAPVSNIPSSQAYVDEASLPLTDVVSGSTAFVETGNKLFIFSGEGWFEIATINTAPTITSGADASYSSSTGGGAITVSMTATDPEGTPVIWSHTVTSGTVEDTTVSNDGSVFTIVPGATPTTFNIAFTASDGINIDTSSSLFTISIPFNYVGTTYGFWAGGYYPSGANTSTNTIDRIQFSPQLSTASYSTLGLGERSGASGKSMTHGYILGGRVVVDYVRKYPYTSDQPVGTIGGLIAMTRNASGHSTDGYIYSAGNMYHAAGSTAHLEIKKLAASADTPASTLSNLMTHSKSDGTGLSSATHAIMGHGTDTYYNDRTLILGWSFASEVPTNFNPTFAALWNSPYTPRPTDFSTTDYGYQVFGSSNIGTGRANRLSFSSGAGVTNVADIGTRFKNQGQEGSAGTNDEVNGYTTGGEGIGGLYYLQFASDTAQTAIGGLSYNLGQGHSSQI